jgi:hypothetical protein
MTREIAKILKLLSLVTPSHIKIKFKPESERPHVTKTVEEIPSTITTRKKKVETVKDSVNRLAKISKKIREENMKKFTDSFDEIIEEVKNIMELIGVEVELDENFKRKIEELKKNINTKKIDESPIEDKGGLILNSKKKLQNNNSNKSGVVRENLFEDIVNNVSKSEFNLQDNGFINQAMHKRNDENMKRRKEIEIDFSQGGLQRFDDANTSIQISGRKRNREYGVTPKPVSRNYEDIEEEEDKDYDAKYTVGENLGTEDNLNWNPYQKIMMKDYNY